ncbi:MAG: hypothetical protein GY820_12695 [Gammaproteobacteria bacterium]|nr:hypothetical protein [Bacteroidota bacterium]MCP4488161.1 hypothetical protein [Gammaproteobacteria bacterium]
MIVKFNNGDGSWSYYEGIKVNAYPAKEEREADYIRERCFLHGTTEGQPVKRANIIRVDGLDTVVYGKDAYLMNDRGNTIQVI